MGEALSRVSLPQGEMSSRRHLQLCSVQLLRARAAAAGLRGDSGRDTNAIRWFVFKPPPSRTEVYRVASKSLHMVSSYTII